MSESGLIGTATGLRRSIFRTICLSANPRSVETCLTRPETIFCVKPSLAHALFVFQPVIKIERILGWVAHGLAVRRFHNDSVPVKQW